MLREVLKKKSESDMRKAIREAPRGLNEIIRHVLRSFSESLKDNPEYADDFNELLAWVICAARPLTLANMQDILRWKSSDGSGWVWLEGSLRRQFASLFLLIREDGLTTADLQRTASIETSHDANGQHSKDEEAFGDLRSPFDFDSDPRTTRVTLNHASIGDFFRTEDEETICAVEGGPPIGVTYRAARMLVIMRCFELLACDENSAEIEIAANLRHYACGALFETLQIIDIAKATTQEKQLIGRHLIRALTTKPSFVWIAETRILMISFFGKENLDMILKWLSDEMVQESLSTEERMWYDKAISGNNADIFRPIAQHIGHRWLQDSTRDIFPCYFICMFLNARKGLLGESDMPAEQILEAAELFDFDKNDIWYENVGETLLGFGCLEEAIEYLERAQKDSSTDALHLRLRVAVIYQTRGHYERAIDLLKGAVEELEHNSNSEDRLHDAYCSLGSCYSAIGQKQAGYEIHLRGLELQKDCSTCACEVLDYLYRQESFAEIMTVLERLDDKILGQSYTYLTMLTMKSMDFFSTFFFCLCTAAHHTGNMDVLMNACTSAVIVAQTQNRYYNAADVQLCLGYIYQVYKHDSELAIRTWEELINTRRDSGQFPEIRPRLETAAVLLARTYLDGCILAEPTSQDCQKYGQKLEYLVAQNTRCPASHPTSTIISTENPGETGSIIEIALGNYYQFCGRQAEATACFSVQVNECIRLFGDDDQDSDWDTYRRLAHLLAGVKHDSLAIGIYHYSYTAYCEDRRPQGTNQTKKGDVQRSIEHTDLQNLSERQNTTDTQGSSDEEDSDFNSDEVSSLVCDSCFQIIAIDGATICGYCHDTHFCETCATQLLAGTLSINICSPKHKLLHIPPRPAAVRKKRGIRDGMFYIENDWVSLEDLKNRVRTLWDI